MIQVRERKCKRAIKTDVIPYYKELKNEQTSVPAKKEKEEDFNEHQQSLNDSEENNHLDVNSNYYNAAESCLICESIDGNFPILKCCNCHLKYHSKCVNITDKVSNTIKKFYCNFCISKNSSLKTIYKDGTAPTYCICKSPDEDRFMIGCDNCDDWFHGDCIKLSEMRASVIEKFYCKPCKNKNPNLEIIYKNGGYITGAISFDYQKECDTQFGKQSH